MTALKNIRMRLSVWKYIDDSKSVINNISIVPKVPISKPCPNKDKYSDEENNDAIRKTKGIIPANSMMRSFGITNLPSTSLAMSQKNIDRVTPIDIIKPLAASIDTDKYGIKKKKDKKNVPVSI